jgi:hypothetical protein
MQMHGRREEGQQIILVSLMLPVLLLFVGLVIDVGNLYFHRRMAQNAADAAAVAGSVQLPDQNSARTTAFAYAQYNGYASSTVEVGFPPGCIGVQINEAVRPLLASLVWNGAFDVGAYARACKLTVPIAASVLVLAEGKTDGALNLSGNSTLTVKNGSLHVNSSSGQAVTAGGSKSKITTATPARIVGGASDLSIFNQKPITGSAPLTDPFVDLAEPSRPGKCSSKQIESSADLVKGTFCYTGGISMNSKDELTLPPGEYWIEKGISVNGPNVKFIADGVMLYIANGEVNFNNCKECRLSPQNSGSYKGITLFGARTGRTGPTFIFTTGRELSLDGIVYNPQGAMELGGGANIEANFVVHTLDITGNSDLTVTGITGDSWETTEYRMTQ